MGLCDTGGMGTREGYRWTRGGWQPSAAQRRILDGLAAGEGNAALAKRLDLSPETVRWHVRQLIDTVVKVDIGPRGIEGIQTKVNGTLTADLYIDCSGFRSLLLFGEGLRLARLFNANLLSF